MGVGVQLLMNAFNITGWHFHSLFKNWAQTQRLCIYDQLRAGVRFLDLRIGIAQNEKIWRIHHGMVYGQRLETTLLHIKQFLDENPSEIVIVGVSHVENFLPVHMDQLLLKINIIFRGMVFRYFDEWRHTPVEDLVEGGNRFLFMMTDLELDWLAKDSTVWVNFQGSFLKNTWANKDTFGEMEEYNKRQVKKFKKIKSCAKEGTLEREVSSEKSRFGFCFKFS
jgi:hypothetical protein